MRQTRQDAIILWHRLGVVTSAGVFAELDEKNGTPDSRCGREINNVFQVRAQ
jgi:hypothetical protein